jgi:2-oxoglutarate ferredoxin oxidoreductase subunit delta
MSEPVDTEVMNGEQAESKARMPRGRVITFPNWCKGCDLCVEFCPAGVLALGPDGHAVVVHPERCTACRWCELHCPDFAIFVTEIERERDDTRQTAAG